MPDSVLTDCPHLSPTAEEVRKLKARVEELEKTKVLYHDVQMDKSNRDRLQAEAPSLGPGLGKAELDGYSQEAIWLFVRNKLMTEQENGESGLGARPVSPEHWAWVALCLSWGHYSLSLSLPPILSLHHSKRQEGAGLGSHFTGGKLSLGENCSRSLEQQGAYF